MARTFSRSSYNKFNKLIGKNKMSQEDAKAVAVAQLRAFIERIERLEEEAMIDLYKDALGMG